MSRQGVLLGKLVFSIMMVAGIVGCGNSRFEVSKFQEEPIGVDSFAQNQGLAAQVSGKDFQYKGALSPTIFFHPLIQDNGVSCQGKSPVPLRGDRGQTLILVCPSTYSTCKMEGSCQIERKGLIYSYNYRDSSPGYPVFMDITHDECIFGFGVQDICLDPFYSVAADMAFHKPGDVIYVPKIDGVKLPSGRVHNGFLIIRDRGGAIKGQHRFDFFTGGYKFQDPLNPFSRLGLGNKNTKFEYYKMKALSAPMIQKTRNFPGLLPQGELEF